VKNNNIYGGKNLPNAEKFKYMQINMDRYLTAAEAGSISNPSIM
jgi:hypothetical protein